MIIFINQKNKTVDIYKKDGFISVPFHDIWKLKTIAGNERILYVTHGINTDVGKVIDTVNQLRGFSGDNKDSVKCKSEEPLFVHATGREAINIPSISIVFMGARDFHPVSNIEKKFGKKIFEDDDVIKMYMSSKKLEILTFSEMTKFLNNYKDKREEMFEKQLNSMIVDGKVSDFIDGGAGDDSTDRDGAVVIDLSKSRNFSGGGSTENEGQLLPEDF